MSRIAVVLLLLLATGTAPAFAAALPQWFEVRSPHFVVITDSSEKQGRHIAGQFERMRSLFQTVLPHASSDAGIPMTVLALKDRKGFQSLLPTAYLAKGALQLDGLFLRTPDRNYILVRLDTETEHPFSIVYHEYTHFVLRKAEWIPLWLNEGLAEFYQNTDIHEKEVILGQPSSDDILYLRQQRLLPLNVLFAVDHNSPYYHEENKGSVFYAESWALTHFIEMTDFQKKTHRLQDYANLVVHHEDPVTAAQKAFGDLGQLQKALDSYVSQSSYQEFRMGSSFSADETSFTARNVSLSDVNSVRADILAANDRKADARSLLEAVLHDDPKNALAYETMGSLAYREHDISAATKWYGEAVQLESQSYLAHYNFAVYTMMSNDATKDAQVESSLRQAIKLEPTFAPSYDALAHFYSMHHKNLDEAYRLIAQAIQIEPEEVRYRLNAAQIAMERENPDAALAILRVAKESMKSQISTVLLDQQIEQITRFKAETERYKADAERYKNQQAPEAAAEAHLVGASASEPAADPYPTAAPSGPRHMVRGTLHAVRCGYPTLLTLTVDQPGKPVSLYSNDYFKIAYSTAYIQKEDLDPCKGMEGKTARVEYTAVADKRVVGQIVSIELVK